MTFTWMGYLDVAKHMADIEPRVMRGDTEAYYRAAVSRAYYAAHKSVHKWMEDNVNYHPPREKVHKDVIRQSQIMIAGPEGARISTMLRDLKLHRTEADYEYIPIRAWNKQRALDVCEETESIMNELSRAKPA